MFIVRINGRDYRDTTEYTDREFAMIMDLYGYMPGNLRAHHYQAKDGPSPIVRAMPAIPIPVYELKRPNPAPVAEGLMLYTAGGPRSGTRIMSWYRDFVLAESDVFSSGLFARVDGSEYKLLSKYKAIPIPFAYAKAYVNDYHRSNVAPQGHKFSVALESAEGRVVGVLIASEPKARHNRDGFTLEINRCCGDPKYHNVCSSLQGRAIRMGKAMGYTRFLSYTMLSEPGSSLKAMGFQKDGIVRGRKNGWDSPSRHRVIPERYPTGDKQRWVLHASA